MRSSGGVNPADSFLVHGDELPELTDEQWTVLTEIGKAGGGVAGDALSRETLGHLRGGVAGDALSRETLGHLLHVQVIAPAGPGRVEITGIVHPPACQGGGAQAGDIVTAAAAVRAGGAVEVPAGPGREPRRGRRPAARWGRLSPSGPVAGLPFPAFPDAAIPRRRLRAVWSAARARRQGGIGPSSEASRAATVGEIAMSNTAGIERLQQARFVDRR